MSPTAHNALVATQLCQPAAPGAVIRIARTALGWNQAELGHRCGYSASQISRWETGRLPLRDITTLRILADVLGLPSEVFGLTSRDPTGAPPASAPLAAIPTTERRARLLVDIALCYAQWDKPDRAYATLLSAERTAPGEVRTRNAVRRLVTQLITAPRHATMPGLPALATRVHATT